MFNVAWNPNAYADCVIPRPPIIYEVDAHHGTPYMVLEYIEERTLGHQSGPSSVPATFAVELAVESTTKHSGRTWRGAAGGGVA